VRTTLTLDEDVAAKLRSVMRQTGRSFKDTVNEVLRSGLAWQNRAKKPKPFKVHARNLGLRPGFNLDCTGRILQQLDELERGGRE